mmetsp:Transcript_62661/g.176653  ORF Transcript_62661/g.176653 Transcript_62661/m.176653 type:complete len:243 (-) Transcript_62661:489-1217(-)
MCEVLPGGPRAHGGPHAPMLRRGKASRRTAGGSGRAALALQPRLAVCAPRFHAAETCWHTCRHRRGIALCTFPCRPVRDCFCASEGGVVNRPGQRDPEQAGHQPPNLELHALPSAQGPVAALVPLRRRSEQMGRPQQRQGRGGVPRACQGQGPRHQGVPRTAAEPWWRALVAGWRGLPAGAAGRPGRRSARGGRPRGGSFARWAQQRIQWARRRVWARTRTWPPRRRWPGPRCGATTWRNWS